jgi:hypothetical protein
VQLQRGEILRVCPVKGKTNSFELLWIERADDARN